jgi:hypothetical protein
MVERALKRRPLLVFDSAQCFTWPGLKAFMVQCQPQLGRVGLAWYQGK